MPRTYDMTAREAARQQTREAILDAAVELFTPAWFDQVTLADVARRAGVSQQTVINHFGSKVNLYLTGLRERGLPQMQAVRDRARAGDVDSIVAAACEDYETSGDGTFRTVALAEREADLADLAAGGRRGHRSFVEENFGPLLPRRGAARDRKLTLLTCALDVTMWRQLRRTEGLGPEQTREHLTELVRAILAG